MDIDVYKQYFLADCVHAGVKRRAAAVYLMSSSGEGRITYTVGVTFFPHVDDEDFAVSYDAVAEKVIYSGKGRRSKKREAGFMGKLRDTADEAASELDGTIYWEEPLTEPRLG